MDQVYSSFTRNYDDEEGRPELPSISESINHHVNVTQKEQAAAENIRKVQRLLRDNGILGLEDNGRLTEHAQELYGIAREGKISFVGHNKLAISAACVYLAARALGLPLSLDDLEDAMYQKRTHLGRRALSSAIDIVQQHAGTQPNLVTPQTFIPRFTGNLRLLVARGEDAGADREAAIALRKKWCLFQNIAEKVAERAASCFPQSQPRAASIAAAAVAFTAEVCGISASIADIARATGMIWDRFMLLTLSGVGQGTISSHLKTLQSDEYKSKLLV